MVATGTAPAMDHGIKGAMTIAVFSREAAILILSGWILLHSCSVKITASIWLQDKAAVAKAVSVIVRKTPAFAPSINFYNYVI